MTIYPVLAGKIVERGLKPQRVAEEIKISPRTFYNRMHGKGSFTWEDVVIIQNKFFPDVAKDELMRKNVETNP